MTRRGGTPACFWPLLRGRPAAIVLAEPTGSDVVHPEHLALSPGGCGKLCGKSYARTYCSKGQAFGSVSCMSDSCGVLGASVCAARMMRRPRPPRSHVAPHASQTSFFIRPRIVLAETWQRGDVGG